MLSTGTVLVTFAFTTLVDEPATLVLLAVIIGLSAIGDVLWKRSRGPAGGIPAPRSRRNIPRRHDRATRPLIPRGRRGGRGRRCRRGRGGRLGLGDRLLEGLQRGGVDGAGRRDPEVGLEGLDGVGQLGRPDAVHRSGPVAGELQGRLDRRRGGGCRRRALAVRGLDLRVERRRRGAIGISRRRAGPRRSAALRPPPRWSGRRHRRSGRRSNRPRAVPSAGPWCTVATAVTASDCWSAVRQPASSRTAQPRHLECEGGRVELGAGLGEGGLVGDALRRGGEVRLGLLDTVDGRGRQERRGGRSSMHPAVPRFPTGLRRARSSRRRDPAVPARADHGPRPRMRRSRSPRPAARPGRPRPCSRLPPSRPCRRARGRIGRSR